VQEALGADLLQSFFAEETTLGLFRCEARFQNWGPKNNTADFLFFDRAMLDFGKPFAIEVGPPGSEASVFAGRITALEAIYAQQQAPELSVLAEDRFQDLRMERRTRTFENITDADVIRQVASQQGLTAQVEVEGPTHRMLAQVNQSDLAFIRERAASVDAQIWIDNRTLYAQSRSRRNSGEVTLTYAQNLIEFSVMADLSHQRTSVRVSGWDVGGKQAIDEEATDAAISAELNGGRSGASTLGSALTERKERIASAVPLSSQEAKGMAEARFRDRARRFITGVGAADGNPKIRVGSVINVQGIGDLFSGKYYVTLARHSFDLRSGYRTRFEVERPGIGG
jgi:phage protein D